MRNLTLELTFPLFIRPQIFIKASMLSQVFPEKGLYELGYRVGKEEHFTCEMRISVQFFFVY